MRLAPESHHPLQHAHVSTFHIVMEGSSVPLGHLLAFNPKRHLNRFRGHLYRAASEQLDGMPPGLLFAALHGAFDPNLQTFPVHIHGLATNGKVALIDALRKLPMYKPAVAGDGRDAALTPVLRSRRPLINMPDPMTYSMKGFWPLRPTRRGIDGRRRAVACPVRRIDDESAHSEYLRFLDKWSLNELTLIMGMHVVKNSLVPL